MGSAIMPFQIVLDITSTVQMRVLFEKMVQKNKKTGWERRMRLCVKEADSTGEKTDYRCSWIKML